MLQLHVWGSNREISVISPECRASAWLLSQSGLDYEIVTSSNTNLSDIHKLPVLLETGGKSTYDREIEGKKYQGYEEISEYLGKYNLNARERLLNQGLLNILGKFDIINQYNLYINPKNFEYTRIQFPKFFPFPMMYNQPLKFYNSANELVRSIGLNLKGGFFTSTENVKEEEEEELVPLSKLHEKTILAKSKEKAILKESHNVVKCLKLVGEYMDYFKMESSERTTLHFTELSTSEVLLFSYIYSLTFDQLKDRFIARYLELKFPREIEFIRTRIVQNNEALYEANFRGPTGAEVPSLYNEVKYQLRM